MKTVASLLILVLVACGGFTSCQTPALVSPQTNVAVTTFTVVQAENALRAAKDTVDLFLRLEDDNEDFVKAKLPKVAAFANKCRETVPDLLLRANTAKNIFKHNRTPDNQSTLNGIMATVMMIVVEAQTYTKQIPQT